MRKIALALIGLLLLSDGAQAFVLAINTRPIRSRVVVERVVREPLVVARVERVKQVRVVEQVQVQQVRVVEQVRVEPIRAVRRLVVAEPVQQFTYGQTLNLDSGCSAALVQPQALGYAAAPAVILRSRNCY